jgi:hypothetical protein
LDTQKGENMKIKKLLISLLFFALPFTIVTNCFSPDKTFAKQSAVNKISTKTNSYTYVCVLVDGKWWIYVYDEQNRLIDVYPDADE